LLKLIKVVERFVGILEKVVLESGAEAEKVKLQKSLFQWPYLKKTTLFPRHSGSDGFL